MTFRLLTQQTDLQSVTPGESVLKGQSVCLPQRDEPAAVFFVASLSEIEKSVLCICDAWMCYLAVFSFSYFPFFSSIPLPSSLPVAKCVCFSCIRFYLNALTDWHT